MIELVPYASGDGACHFSFIENGKAGGKRPTLDDAQRYLDQHPKASKYRADNWRAVLIENEPVLVAPVTRINENTLAIDGKEFTYHVDQSSMLLQDANHITDTAITIKAQYKGETVNVRNYGMRLQLRHFLMNEKALTEQPPLPKQQPAVPNF